MLLLDLFKFADLFKRLRHQKVVFCRDELKQRWGVLFFSVEHEFLDFVISKGFSGNLEFSSVNGSAVVSRAAQKVPVPCVFKSIDVTNVDSES